MRTTFLPLFPVDHSLQTISIVLFDVLRKNYLINLSAIYKHCLRFKLKS